MLFYFPELQSQSACFRHNKIITKEYVPYEYTGIRKLSGKNLPWKPFISIYHLSVFYPTGFFLCTDPLAWRNGDYLYKEGTRHYHRGLHTIPGQCRNARTYHSGTITFDWTIRKRKYGIWKYYFHPQILLSKQTDTCSTDYFSPLMDGTLTIPVLYQPGDPYYKEISACVDANDEISKPIRQLTSFSSKASFLCCFIFSSISAVPEMPRKKIISLWKKWSWS